jgi:hypothetical protein
MSFPFNAQGGLVLVTVEVTGPTGALSLWLALDTGATYTSINAGPLVAVGYDPALAHPRLQITTASGIEFMPQITVMKINALGQDRFDFPVLCHTLPSSARIDGLLGLDFLRGQTLTIDFRSGQITLA